jgi:hypothetical protein
MRSRMPPLVPPPAMLRQIDDRRKRGPLGRTLSDQGLGHRILEVRERLDVDEDGRKAACSGRA